MMLELTQFSYHKIAAQIKLVNGHKSEMKGSRNYLTNHTNPATTYLWPREWTHTLTQILPHESDFKKPGAHLV